MGFVADKIKSQSKNGKNGVHVARARKGWRPSSLTKIIKKAASISELLTDDDQEENLRVIREAKRAVHRVYDTQLKRLVEVPDYKTRLAATTLDLAYREGKPIERSMEVSGSYKELSEVLAELERSPEARRLLSPELFATLRQASAKEVAQQLHGDKGISGSEQKTP
jgi:hypothetical protein